jgi:uncharacterized membrane protein
MDTTTSPSMSRAASRMSVKGAAASRAAEPQPEVVPPPAYSDTYNGLNITQDGLSTQAQIACRSLKILR